MLKEYAIQDHLGSTRVVLQRDAQKNVTVLNRTDYEPFGGVLWQSGLAQRKGFIDKETDTESGLGDFGVRKYDDEIGRFTSIDVLWEEYRSLSPYNYCGNNPLMLKDPTGLGWGDEIVNAVAKRYNELEASFERVADKTVASFERVADKTVASFERVADKTVASFGRMLDKTVASFERVADKLEGTDKVSNVEVSNSKQQVTGSSESGKDGSNTNPFAGPVVAPVMVVDIVGNIIPVGAGQQVTGSPNGEFMQVRDEAGTQTGVRKDGPHGPRHSPEGRVPHAHRPDVPGSENWLPVRPMPGQSVQVP